ncbi:MAG TPA: tetratricopeptide repeat protein [Flavobacteriales bacterium]|nr:tetratricopeptide repeat protein [Flavobacteriales bacterium]
MRIVAPLLVLFLYGCAAKRGLHEGATLERNGRIAEARAAYEAVWERKPKSTAAQEGFKRMAQRELADLMGAAIMSYRVGGMKEGDAQRQSALNFRRQIIDTGIDLRWDPSVDAAREEARLREADALYQLASVAYREDRFGQAIELARQCIQLNPKHAEAPHLMRMAEAEPIYREGQQAEQLGLWRKAHERYEAVARLDAAHKDVMLRVEHCRRMARFTVAYLPVQESRAKRTIMGFEIGSGPVDQELATLVQRELLALKDPFLQLIDRGSTDVILAEQRRQMSGPYSEQVAEAGKLLGARYILTGRVLKYDDLLKRDLEVQVQLIDAQTGRIHLSEVARAAKVDLGREGAAKLSDVVARRIAALLRGFDPQG